MFNATTAWLMSAAPPVPSWYQALRMRPCCSEWVTSYYQHVCLQVCVLVSEDRKTRLFNPLFGQPTAADTWCPHRPRRTLECLSGLTGERDFSVSAASFLLSLTKRIKKSCTSTNRSWKNVKHLFLQQFCTRGGILLDFHICDKLQGFTFLPKIKEKLIS